MLDGKTYGLYKRITVKFRKLYGSSDFYDFPGYSQDKAVFESSRKTETETGTDWERSTSNGLKVDFYYTANPFTLDLYGYNGMLLSSSQKKLGSDISTDLNAAAAKAPVTGAIFEGWYLSPAFENAYKGGNKMPQGLALYAKWSMPERTITYKDGDTVLKEESVVYAGTGKYVPEREGYEFAGLYEDPELTIEFDQYAPVTENKTVYVKWEESSFVSYTVKHVFWNDDHSNVLYERVEGPFNDTVGNTVSKNAMTSEEIAALGQDFANQTYLPDKFSDVLTLHRAESAADRNEIVFEYSPLSSIEYKVQYVRVQGDASRVLYTEEETYPATAANLFVTPSRAGQDWAEENGYTFVGNGQVEASFSSGQTNVVSIPVEPVTYSINYELNDGSWTAGSVAPASYNVEMLGSVVVPNPVKQGYIFRGWELGADTYDKNDPDTKFVGTDLVLGTGTVGALNLSAKWEASPNTKYTVKHLLQDVEGDGYTEDESLREEMSGTTGADTAAAAKSLTGFTAQPFEQVKIAADGTAVVEIKYNRNTYTVTYKVTGEHFAADPYGTPQTGVRYGAALTLIPDNMAKAGYEWSGWSELPKTMPANDVTVSGSYTASTDTKYTVKHLLQDVEGDGYTEDESLREEMSGTTGADTAAAAKSLTGFTAQPFEQVKIAADGTAVVEIKYNRNTYTVTYKVTGEHFAADPYGTPQTGVRYGAALTLIPDNMAKAGYEWSGWSELPKTMPANDVTVSGSYTASTDTKYTVKHLLQDVEGDGYTEDESLREEMSGTTGADTAAAAKSLTGFTAQPFEQVKIAADGTAVVEIKYNRNTYTVTYKVTGEHFAADPYGTPQTGVRYGAALTLIPDNMAKAGYEWSGWSELPKTMPANDVTVSGSYTASTDTKYTVKHLLQDVEGDGYTEDESLREEMSGTTGADTAAAAKSLTGFTAQPFEQVKIAADGTAVVEIKYNRNTYTVTYKVTGEHFAADPYGTPQTGVRYGAALTLIPDNMAKAGYEWSGWSELPKTMPANDVTVSGSYTASTDTKYTVKHLLQDVEGDGYTEDESLREEMSGTTGADTAAAAKSLTGFTAQPFEQVKIAADGTAVVEIKYNRNTYTVTYKVTGEHFAADPYGTPQTGVRYGAALTLIPDNMAKAGYEWSGWSELPKTMPANDVTVSGSYTASTDTKYTVKHLLQDVEGDGYTEDESLREEMSGTTGADTAAAAKSLTGFTAQPFEQVKIAADGTAVVEIKYNRNTYTVTYKVTGEHFAADPYGTPQTGVRYGAALTLIPDNMAKAGYEWSGWSELPKTMPANDVTVSGSYTASTDTKYTVKHLLQDVEGDGYTEDESLREEMSGTTGADTAAAAKSLTGFTAQPFEQVKIAADGTAVVEIKYNRNTYTVTYKVTGEHFAADPYGTPQTGVRYGAALTLIPDNMAKAGYEWSGWSELPKTMPANDVTVSGSYTANDQRLTVNWVDETGAVLKSAVTTTVKYDSEYDVTDQRNASLVGPDGKTYVYDFTKGDVAGTVKGDVDVTFTYAIDEKGGTDPETGEPTLPDGVADKYQATVTYHVANGTFGQGGTTSVAEVVTVAQKNEDGTVTSLDYTMNVPKNMVPAEGYDQQPGAWGEPMPGTETLEGGKSYDYTFTYGINVYSVTVSVANGTSNVGEVGTTGTYGSDLAYTFAPADGYALDSVTVDGQPAVLTNGGYTFSALNANHSISVVYAIDSNRDGIPDSRQAIVNYNVANGTWADGTAATVTEYVSMYAYRNGEWEPVEPVLNVPAGMVANTGYSQASGAWRVNPAASQLVAGGEVTFTYAFAAIPTVVVPPTTPVTPAAVTPAPTPAAPAAPAAPAPAAPAPAAAPAAATPAPAAEPIEDDATPQAAAPAERTPLAEPEEIEDEATPMGAFDEPHCWVLGDAARHPRHRRLRPRRGAPC